MADETMTEKITIERLEAIVDRHGLHRTIALLATVCDDKATHHAVNWQNSKTAKVWAACAQTLDSTAAIIERKGL